MKPTDAVVMSFLSLRTAAVGMTTARWRELPVWELPVAALTPTQSVHELRELHEGSDVSSGDEYIHVVRLGGAMYVQDGHHRLARARCEHQWMIEARVLDLTPRGAPDQ